MSQLSLDNAKEIIEHHNASMEAINKMAEALTCLTDGDRARGMMLDGARIQYDWIYSTIEIEATYSTMFSVSTMREMLETIKAPEEP